MTTKNFQQRNGELEPTWLEKLFAKLLKLKAEKNNVSSGRLKSSSTTNALFYYVWNKVTHPLDQSEPFFFDILEDIWSLGRSEKKRQEKD